VVEHAPAPLEQSAGVFGILFWRRAALGAHNTVRWTADVCWVHFADPADRADRRAHSCDCWRLSGEFTAESFEACFGNRQAAIRAAEATNRMAVAISAADGGRRRGRTSMDAGEFFLDSGSSSCDWFGVSAGDVPSGAATAARH